MVPLRGENNFKPRPQNRILVPLRGENNFKPHPQNRILVPLGGEHNFKPSCFVGVAPTKQDLGTS